MAKAKRKDREREVELSAYEEACLIDDQADLEKWLEDRREFRDHSLPFHMP